MASLQYYSYISIIEFTFHSSKADNETEREVLILGHVSMITDMVLLERFLPFVS